VRWLEARGVDVEYTTDYDTGGPDGRVGNHKLFIAVGHDEYTSIEALDRLKAAVDDGTSLAFLSGDTMYWQVRYEGRVQICYKDFPQEDPMYGVDNRHVTTRFRDPPVNYPENAVIGIMSWGRAISDRTDWIVQNADHWIYEGTGLQNGDALQGMIGPEWDLVFDNGMTPEGLVVLAHSAVSDSTKPGFVHDASIYERGDAFVFAAGTIDFARGMVDEPRAQTILENVLRKAGVALP
jgi:hypothetical protein